MMQSLLVRANVIARAAQRNRIERIARTVRDRHLVAESGTDCVIVRGRGLVRKWLADPLLRFAGRSGS